MRIVRRGADLRRAADVHGAAEAQHEQPGGIAPVVGWSDRGSISAFVVLLLVALFALLGLVVDGGRAMAAGQLAHDEAEQAARAGAGALSPTGLRSGRLVLDPQTAIADAEAYTLRAGHPGTAEVSGGAVTVKVHYAMPTSILGIVGISSLPISATASAIDVHGIFRES